MKQYIYRVVFWNPWESKSKLIKNTKSWKAAKKACAFHYNNTPGIQCLSLRWHWHKKEPGYREITCQIKGENAYYEVTKERIYV